MLLQCLGLENLLSDKALERATRNRRSHVRKVLKEQERQWKLNIWDAEAICRVSESSSTKSKDKAMKLAIGYWGLGSP